MKKKRDLYNGDGYVYVWYMNSLADLKEEYNVVNYQSV